MPGSLQGRYIRLELIKINDLPLPSERIPAGFYVSINVDSKRHWKSPVRVVSSDESEVLGDIVILSPRQVPELSVEIRVSYELGRTLGNGEVVAKFETSWDELLDRGDEPFDISFPPVSDDHPSLTLKAAVLPSCDDQDSAPLDSIVECDIARETDVGHERFATYVTSKTVSHLNDAVEHFQLVLDQCPVGHPDRAGALTNLAWARLKGYTQKDLQDIDSITSLFREALVLRPQGHPDHPLYLYHVTEALSWRHIYQHTTADICESAQLYYKLLSLCPEGTYLRSIAAGANGVDYVIRECNKLPTDASDECIHLGRVVLELCPLGHQQRPLALSQLIAALGSRFKQCGSVNDLDECIQCGREAVSLCSEGNSHRAAYLIILADSLQSRLYHQNNPRDLNEAISLFEEALRLHPVGHIYHGLSLDRLGAVLINRFQRCDDVNDIIRAISHHREALTLCPPGSPGRTFTLNCLAVALKKRYDKLDASEDLDEAIDLFRISLQLRPHGHPLRDTILQNLSFALSSRFTQTQKDEDVEEAIRICQESLETLPSLHPERYFSYRCLHDAYLSRYSVQRKSADLSLAVENFRLASRHPTQGFPLRILGAIAWVRESELYQHESALEAYHTCLDLFNNHMMTRSSIISRREAVTAFRSAQSLPVDAASCAIRRDDPRRAVELLEQGRGHQWSLASRLRTPLEDLMSASPELANKLSEISKYLSDAQGSAGSADRAAADRAAIQYRKLQEQWGAVVADIRNLKGFSRFLLPPSYEDLQAAARHGPVTILIGSQYSCSAIIVMASGEPHHVPLPSVTLTDLKNLKDRFARAIRQASSMGPKVPRNDLIVLLRAVWDEIMLPIVNVLQHDLKLNRLPLILLATQPILLHRTIMPGSLEGQYIRLELIRINDLPLPSERIPAGFYVSINVDSKRHWKSPVRVVSSDESEVLGDIVILSPRQVPELSVEIRVSYELCRMLGNGEVVAKFETSLDELLDRGDEPFDISFPHVGDDHPSLTLKATVLPSCDNQDSAPLDSIDECKIARETDAGHERFATYVTSKTVSHLNDAVEHFQLVLDKCPVSHPDRAGALTNLAWARLKGYIRKDLQDIDSVTSLFREALVLRPQSHPDHLLYLYHITEALNWRHDYQHTTADIWANGVDYVIRECNKLPIDASDEGIHLQRVVLELCPLGNEHRPEALDKLAWALITRFEKCGSIDDLDECIQHRREAVSLCSEGHSKLEIYLNNLAYSLDNRFGHQGKNHDLDEAISLYEDVLRLRPVGHKSRGLSLNNLGLILLTRYNQDGDVNNINRAISLHREALTLRPPGNSHRDTTLNNLALALETRYNELDVGEDLNEAIDLYRDCLQLRQHKNEDVEEAIQICQETLVSLPPLHPDRHYSYLRLREAYMSRYRIQHDPTDLSLAMENFRMASRHPTQGFHERIWGAIRWIRQSELYQHESALEAYHTYLDLFNNHVMTRSSIISRREAATAFRSAQSLPVDAASCAIRRDDLRRAVELLEQGRGQQWSLASRLRTPLEDLMSASPELANKLSEISKLLSDVQGSAGSADRAAADRAAIQYRRLQEQWGAVVADIRNLKGFSRFLLPPSYEDLQAAARHGPVIILIASQYSSEESQGSLRQSNSTII
ncbi:hypothetical protein BDR05DRAFT_999166 [Suillus weaverae]|nr:hypothetical protein BDR05DRAFT_999166 [Suillus weaverae]